MTVDNSNRMWGGYEIPVTAPDISPENVAKLPRNLREIARDGILTGNHRAVKAALTEAADMLEALAAKLAEVEAERDRARSGEARLSRALNENARAVAAEAENAKLLEALARSKRLRDQYREALDAEREHSNPARAALQVKP